VLGGGGGKPVPLVTNQTLAKAEAAITKAGLKFQVHRQPSDVVKKGLVIDTSPAGGNVVAAGSKVVIDVSTGPQKVSVPDVRGKSASAATQLLQAKGFQVSQQTAQNSTAAPNTVVSQSPGPGKMVTKGSSVTLFVSPGGNKLPNVVGQNVQLAEGELQNAGFTFNVQYQPVTGVADGTVLNQSPHNVGQVYPAGTKVTLTVAQAVTPSATPTVTPTASPTPTGIIPTSGTNGH
jgi:serine/threonine-protein kinase